MLHLRTEGFIPISDQEEKRCKTRRFFQNKSRQKLMHEEVAAFALYRALISPGLHLQQSRSWTPWRLWEAIRCLLLSAHLQLLWLEQSTGLNPEQRVLHVYETRLERNRERSSTEALHTKYKRGATFSGSSRRIWLTNHHQIKSRPSESENEQYQLCKKIEKWMRLRIPEWERNFKQLVYSQITLLNVERRRCYPIYFIGDEVFAKFSKTVIGLNLVCYISKVNLYHWKIVWATENRFRGLHKSIHVYSIHPKKFIQEKGNKTLSKNDFVRN